MNWRQYFAAGQRQLPKTATFRERGALTRQLAAEWRAGRKSPSRRNPDVAGMDTGKLLKYGLIGAVIFVGVRALGQRQGATLPPPEAIPNPMLPQAVRRP